MNMDTQQDIESQLERPRFIMMNGPTGVGKSTWVENFLSQKQSRSWTIISADAVLAVFAARLAMDPNDVFKIPHYRDECVHLVISGLREALQQGENIIFDNSMVQSEMRRYFLQQVKQYGREYHTTSVDIMVTEHEQQNQIKQRNAERGEKGESNLETSLAQHETYTKAASPSIDEGFDLVLQVPSQSLKKTQWIKPSLVRIRVPIGLNYENA